MQADLPTEADKARKLTIGDAREQMIQTLTDHWQASLVTLARKLTEQGFSELETLDLCESYRPMFEQNMTQALRQFDENADQFIAQCGGSVG